MMDEVRANGGTVNVKKLSESLGIPVIPISAAKNEGVSELADKMQIFPLYARSFLKPHQ